jgi:FlaA1/EpsC-like NDP-sugar epimerase
MSAMLVLPSCKTTTRARVSRLVRQAAPLLAVDAFAWMAAVPVALTARYGFGPNADQLRDAAFLAAIAALLQLGFTTSVIVRTGWRHVGSFGEFVSLTTATGLTTTAVFALNAPRRFAPFTVPVIAGAIALLVQMAVRAVRRRAQESRNRPDFETAQPVIVFGAGEAGAQVVRALLSSRTSPYVPLAMLDDDPSKADLRVAGVPVVGTRAALADAVHAYGAKVVVLAVPSAHADLIREVADRTAMAGAALHIVPSLGELFAGSALLTDIRPVTEADLLGRHEIDTDLASIAGYIKGRRVLVTGAGGSIGSELCRQVAEFGPETLVMLDRDESALHVVQLSLYDRARLDDPNLVVADIRDAERMHEVFQRHLPDVVFHAAALKHLTLLQMHPTEAVKTNIVGTQNVLDAAVASGVRTFVNISTDKAANPTSVLGYTKRIAERLTAAINVDGTEYLSVRFGNVLGSRGSVLTVFRHQIEAGGPVTVTHPDVSRFFMTVEEAVQLVIQAGAIGRSGETLVLDMGEPVVISKVAQRLIDASRLDVRIEYTGLKPGEKMHEELFGDGESDERPRHPKISHVPVAPLRPADIWSPGEPTHSVAERLPEIAVAQMQIA